MPGRAMAPCDFSGLYDVFLCREGSNLVELITLRAFSAAEAERKAAVYVAAGHSLLPAADWRVCGSREVER